MCDGRSPTEKRLAEGRKVFFRYSGALICHEEGKLLGLPLNRALRHPDSHEIYDVIAGTFFLCGAPPESEHFESLTEEQMERYTEHFAPIELFVGGAAR